MFVIPFSMTIAKHSSYIGDLPDPRKLFEPDCFNFIEQILQKNDEIKAEVDAEVLMEIEQERAQEEEEDYSEAPSMKKKKHSEVDPIKILRYFDYSRIEVSAEFITDTKKTEKQL